MIMPYKMQPLFSIKTPDLKIIECNATFLAYIGKTDKDEVIGQSDADFCWNQYADIYQKHELEALAGDQYSIISPGIDHAGHQGLFLQTKVQKLDQHGSVVGVICQAIEILNPCFHQMIQVLKKWQDSHQSHYYLARNNLNLSPREQEILFYLIRGKTAKSTAKLLNLSPRTVETYLQHLKTKLGCRTKSELIEYLIAQDFMQTIPRNLNVTQALEQFSYSSSFSSSEA